MTHARFPRLLGVATAIVALAALAPAVAASPRTGDLQVSKECSEYTGAVDDFCTITSSNLNAIRPGSRVYYLQAADWNTMTLDSDIVIDGPGSNAAYGHVTLSFLTGEGSVTFSGGSGVFTGFQASVAVSPTGGANFAWDGTYSFSPND
jgi:hypothetical protein